MGLAAGNRRRRDAEMAAFARDVLPGLAGVPLARIAETTGLSERSASLIRRGARVPQRRHWDALRTLAAETNTRAAEAAARRARTVAAGRAAAAAWEQDHGEHDDGTDFARDILPGLAGVPLSMMAETAGLSLSHCSAVRRGLIAPHRRHWAALRALAVEVAAEREAAPDFGRDILPGLVGVPLTRLAAATGLSTSACSLIRRGLNMPRRKHWNALMQLAAEQKSCDEP